MDLITLAAIALGLSLYSFAVSISCGVVESQIRFRNALRITFAVAVNCMHMIVRSVWHLHTPHF